MSFGERITNYPFIPPSGTASSRNGMAPDGMGHFWVLAAIAGAPAVERYLWNSNNTFTRVQSAALPQGLFGTSSQWLRTAYHVGRPMAQRPLMVIHNEPYVAILDTDGLQLTYVAIDVPAGSKQDISFDDVGNLWVLTSQGLVLRYDNFHQNLDNYTIGKSFGITGYVAGVSMSVRGIAWGNGLIYVATNAFFEAYDAETLELVDHVSRSDGGNTFTSMGWEDTLLALQGGVERFLSRYVGVLGETQAVTPSGDLQVNNWRRDDNGAANLHLRVNQREDSTFVKTRFAIYT